MITREFTCEASSPHRRRSMLLPALQHRAPSHLHPVCTLVTSATSVGLRPLSLLYGSLLRSQNNPFVLFTLDHLQCMQEVLLAVLDRRGVLLVASQV